MKDYLTFEDKYKKLEPTLTSFIPIINRVHGSRHPEFHDVSIVYEKIKSKLEDSKQATIDFDYEFAQLKSLTNDYRIPNDVCETYTAVYKMLALLNKTYDQYKGRYK